MWRFRRVVALLSALVALSGLPLAAQAAGPVPQVQAVAGCADAQGNSTSNCPTAGGVQLQVFGSGFSQGVPTVNVCLQPVLVSDTPINCILLPGTAGQKLSVLVTTDGGTSAVNSDVTLTYAAVSGGGTSDGDGNPPPAGQTPELDSVLLFASGLSGLGAYGLRWRRARRRTPARSTTD
jgi:hypothetical protein